MSIGHSAARSPARRPSPAPSPRGRARGRRLLSVETAGPRVVTAPLQFEGRSGCREVGEAHKTSGQLSFSLEREGRTRAALDFRHAQAPDADPVQLDALVPSAKPRRPWSVRRPNSGRTSERRRPATCETGGRPVSRPRARVCRCR